MKILEVIKNDMVRELITKFNVTHELVVSISLVTNWGKFIDFSIPKDVKNIIVIVPEDFDCDVRNQIKSVRRELSVIVLKLPEIKGKLYVLY
ncbi:DUF4898 domain-containing protein [Stygiolobus azoricus]|uniref:DUF4898 domain-containing protein n=1 Tax=Stygiolobus azoricus TaxID=41675 RepID=A0A650CNG7_9CREN|nr:DUF4898 domain-containing protein [Stygiolobus azoricus]QGR19235.1 DUF4898 domain-containing protein [Stygiolobus azoricus]